MKIKKWLIGLITVGCLFTLSEEINIHAASLPNTYCHYWINNHNHMVYNIHHTYARITYTNDPTIHGYIYNFKYIKHGYYNSIGRHDNMQPEPFKLINRNTLKAYNSAFTHIYMHITSKSYVNKQYHKFIQYKQHKKAKYYKSNAHYYYTGFKDYLRYYLSDRKDNGDYTTDLLNLNDFKKYILKDIHNYRKIYPKSNYGNYMINTIKNTKNIIHKTDNSIQIHKQINILKTQMAYDKKDIPNCKTQYEIQRNDPDLNNPNSEMYDPNSANSWLQNYLNDKKQLDNDQQKIIKLEKSLK